MRCFNVPIRLLLLLKCVPLSVMRVEHTPDLQKIQRKRVNAVSSAVLDDTETAVTKRLKRLVATRRFNKTTAKVHSNDSKRNSSERYRMKKTGFLVTGVVILLTAYGRIFEIILSVENGHLGEDHYALLLEEERYGTAVTRAAWAVSKIRLWRKFSLMIKYEVK